MPVETASFPLPLEQAQDEALNGKNDQARIVGIRSLRYHIDDATDDTQLRINTSILDLYGSITHEYRRAFESRIAAGETPEEAAGRIRNHPVITAISEALRRILSRPALQGGCFDHEHAWRLDFLELNGCNLAYAVLKGASLCHSNLAQSRLEHTDLSEADLSGVDFSGARLAHADLSDAELSGAKLAWADLSHARMNRAFINQADLTGAVLDHALLHHAFLSETDMTKASLTGADLTGANVFAAKLSQVRLQEADLTGTGITSERIRALTLSVQASPETRWGMESDRDGINPLASTYYEEQPPGEEERLSPA